MVDTCGIEPPSFVCTDDDLDPSILSRLTLSILRHIRLAVRRLEYMLQALEMTKLIMGP
jgi:hypothetical protein